MAYLSTQHRSAAQKIINNTPKGVYTLSQLYGTAWANISDPTSFGKRFKESVNAGHLNNIQHNTVGTNNHQKYKII